jgi:hypothetical protein
MKEESFVYLSQREMEEGGVCVSMDDFWRVSLLLSA